MLTKIAEVCTLIFATKVQEAIEEVLKIDSLDLESLVSSNDLPDWRQAELNRSRICMTFPQKLKDKFIGAIEKQFMTCCQGSTTKCDDDVIR